MCTCAIRIRGRKGSGGAEEKHAWHICLSQVCQQQDAKKKRWTGDTARMFSVLGYFLLPLHCSQLTGQISWDGSPIASILWVWGIVGWCHHTVTPLPPPLLALGSWGTGGAGRGSSGRGAEHSWRGTALKCTTMAMDLWDGVEKGGWHEFRKAPRSPWHS